MNEMFKELLTDFKKVGDVEDSVIKKYNGVLADDIIELWKEYGYGSFYNSFMKIINPDEFMEIYGALVENVTEDIPIFATGMGDIIVYSTNIHTFINYRSRYGTIDYIPNLFEGLANKFKRSYRRKEDLIYLPYEEAINKYGEPEYEQCFGYTPLLCLGGYENVDALEKVDLMVHLEIISQFQEPFVWID